MSLLFLRVSPFHDYFCFLFRISEALTESNAPAPVQKTVLEKTCTLDVSMLPIGSSSNT